MKISVAQIASIAGDVTRNITRHRQLIELAIAEKADAIFFPELSLTGYEPRLAKALALNAEDDPRLEAFQILANNHNISIGVGFPVKTKAGVSIGMGIFQPQKPRSVYFKKYLHPDEDEHFVAMDSFSFVTLAGRNVAPAICYEISVQWHTDAAFSKGAEIYVASVAKSQRNITAALDRLSDIAREYFVPVLMSNAVGMADGEVCAGHSAVWRNGKMAGQLGQEEEGILVYDTETYDLTARRAT